MHATFTVARVITCALILSLSACLQADEPPALAAAEQALSAPERTREQGELWLGTTNEAALTHRDRAHAWAFELPARGSIELNVHASASGPDVDAIVHLFRTEATG